MSRSCFALHGHFWACVRKYGVLGGLVGSSYGKEGMCRLTFGLHHKNAFFYIQEISRSWGTFLKNEGRKDAWLKSTDRRARPRGDAPMNLQKIY